MLWMTSIVVARLLLRYVVDVDAKDGTGGTTDEITKARKNVLNLLPDFQLNPIYRSTRSTVY